MDRFTNASDLSSWTTLVILTGGFHAVHYSERYARSALREGDLHHTRNSGEISAAGADTIQVISTSR